MLEADGMAAIASSAGVGRESAVAPLAANPLPGHGDPTDGLLRAAKLSVPEAAEVLGIGETKMRELVRNGEIPVVRIMGKVLLLERDLEAYLQSRYGTLRTAERKADRLPPLPRRVLESGLLKNAS